VQQLGLEVAVDLLTQARHEDVHHVGARIEVVAPDVREDHRLGEHASLVTKQILEQLVLTRAQVDRPSIPLGASAEQVERQAPQGQPCRFGLPGRSPDERLQTRQQFCKRERLRQVVVAARLQAFDAIVDSTARAQNQYRREHAARTDAVDQSQPIETRQHHVDNGGIVAALQGKLDALFTIPRDVDRMAGFGQSLAHEVGNRRIVFDHEHSHDTASVRHTPST